MTAVVFALLSAQASAGLILQLKSADYNPTNGIWTDTSGSGNNATAYSIGVPTLVAGVTPNGSAAVYLSGSSSDFGLATSISGSTFTLFAYLQPNATQPQGQGAIIGGASGSTGFPQWVVYPTHQALEQGGVGGQGNSTSAVPTTAFSMIDVSQGASGGSFRLNGVFDGIVTTASYTQPLTRIGSNNSGWAGLPHWLNYAGYIAEVRIYDTAMSDAEKAAVEGQLLATYDVPEPSTLALLAAGLIGLLCYAWRKRR